MSDITVRRPIRWYSSSETNVGTVREINEDAVISIPEMGLWAVADGMGGYEAGNVASSMIVQSLQEVERKDNLNDIITAVEDKILDANNRILEYADIMLDGRMLGSTVICLIIHGQVGVCLWVGDSRLYRVRNNDLHQLSRDHSQVEELLQQGMISVDEVENHPDSNVITRAIGTGPDLCIDINVFNVQFGDAFLLCSDGLYNSVNPEDITSEMEQTDTTEIVNKLIARSLENGANDNVSVILVKGSQEKQTNNNTQTELEVNEDNI